jgi:hypothetical protein
MLRSTVARRSAEMKLRPRSKPRTQPRNASQFKNFTVFAPCTFDVEQTEGKDLPSLTDVKGDVTGVRERLVAYVESQGIKLSYSEKIAPTKGLSSGKRITLLTGMQPAEEFSTLVHELAHEMLHRSERRTFHTTRNRIDPGIGRSHAGTAAADGIRRLRASASSG